MDKLAMLNEILAQEPDNAFARYGLAMELIAQGNEEGALAEFAETTRRSPDYVPAYQMSAQTLAKLHRSPEAITRLKDGLAAAERTHNHHAASEMGALLDELEG